MVGRISPGGICMRAGENTTLKGGGTEQRGWDTKNLKSVWRGGGKLAQWVGALKRGARTPLRTMILVKGTTTAGNTGTAANPKYNSENVIFKIILHSLIT